MYFTKRHNTLHLIVLFSLFAALPLLSGCAHKPDGYTYNNSALGSTGQTVKDFRAGWNAGAAAEGLPQMPEEPAALAGGQLGNAYHFFHLGGGVTIQLTLEKDRKYAPSAISVTVANAGAKNARKLFKLFVNTVLANAGTDETQATMAKLDFEKAFSVSNSPKKPNAAADSSKLSPEELKRRRGMLLGGTIINSAEARNVEFLLLADEGLGVTLAAVYR